MTNPINTILSVQADEKPQFHGAGRIVADPWTIIENGCLEVCNGFIVDIHKNKPDHVVIDHGPGVLMSPLINTHLHLELSALKDSVPFDHGFGIWIKTLLEKRAAFSDQELIQAAKASAQELKDSGTLWVGDIASLDIVRPIASQLGLNGLFFQEFLGTAIPDTALSKGELLSFGVAGHAPHTTSPQLLTALKKKAQINNLPFSIHLAESDDETRFLSEQKGEWADFLISRGIEFSSWQIQSNTPVGYLSNLGILDASTIAVHLLNVSDKDMECLAQSKTKVCLCPRSNENLHKKLPDIEKMIQKRIQPALGTDSLASCNTLDLFDEMAFVKNRYPLLDPTLILAMGTIYSARALGVQHLTGSLEPGKRADFLYVPVETNNKNDLLEKLITNES
ncbi:MAG: amidohydrolase family protein [Pseudomonadota bacterium]